VTNQTEHEVRAGASDVKTPLRGDGADAQALEHALTRAEAEIQYLAKELAKWEADEEDWGEGGGWDTIVKRLTGEIIIRAEKRALEVKP